MSVQGNKGFTVFELMVVMAIVGIAASFVLPSLRDVTARSKTNAAADELVGLLSNGKSMAATRQRAVFITRTNPAAGETYSLRMGSNSSTVLASYFKPASSTAVITRSPSIDEIAFQPTGLVINTTTSAAVDLVMTVCDSSTPNEFGRTVKMNRLGRITNVANKDKTTCNP